VSVFNSSLTDRPSASNIRWTVCAMLFAATTINYMDRQVIGILKPTLMHDIGLTEQAYGNIVACFQAAYAVGLIVAGRLVDRLGSRLSYALVMGVWSIAAIAHALVTTAFGFGVARVALGVGEAGNFPAAIKTVADWFPKRERSFATGLFNAGTTTGAMVAPIAVPWITVRYGWHAAFVATGFLGAPWIVWWYWKYRAPSAHSTVSDAELTYIRSDEEAHIEGSVQPTWASLLKYRQTWALAAARFLTDPIWWFYLFWLPGFLDAKFHLGLSGLGKPLLLIYAASAIGGVAGGWLPALFTRFGLKPGTGRLATMLICACLSVPMVLAGHVDAMWLAILLLSLAVAGHQGWSANMYTTVSDVFPPQAVGSVTGITAMAGSVGGVLLSLEAGHILQLTGSYTTLFILAGSVYLVAWLLIRLFAGGLQRVTLEA
jgi:ACS family hexuronate transporter-like MFS transporter